MEAVCVPAHLVPPGSPQAKQLCQLHAQLSLGRSATGKKKCLASVCTGLLWSCPALFDPVDCGLPGFSVRDGVLQARILECIGQDGLPYPLEHYISCCPGHQLSRVTGAARIPVTQAAAPSPHLALTGANPSPPGQSQELPPQWTTHM